MTSPETNQASDSSVGEVATSRWPIARSLDGNLLFGVLAGIVILVFPFKSILVFALAIGLVASAAISLYVRKSRKIIIPIATIVAAVAGLTASTGMRIDSYSAEYFQWKEESPYYAQHYYQYRYLGTKRTPRPNDAPTDLFGNVKTGFVAGEVKVHIQAPDDNKVVFDGRMTAGEIIVRNVDSEGKVTSEIASQSGIWVEKKQTYGSGSKELRVKVHGGVGRLVLEIHRGEWKEANCHSTSDNSGSFFCD